MLNRRCVATNYFSSQLKRWFSCFFHVSRKQHSFKQLKPLFSFKTAHSMMASWLATTLCMKMNQISEWNKIKSWNNSNRSCFSRWIHWSASSLCLKRTFYNFSFRGSFFMLNSLTRQSENSTIIIEKKNKRFRFSTFERRDNQVRVLFNSILSHVKDLGHWHVARAVFERRLAIDLLAAARMSAIFTKLLVSMVVDCRLLLAKSFYLSVRWVEIIQRHTRVSLSATTINQVNWSQSKSLRLIETSWRSTNQSVESRVTSTFEVKRFQAACTNFI